MADGNTASKSYTTPHQEGEGDNDSYHRNRAISIKGSDRSFLNKPGVTRNVHTSTMPGSTRHGFKSSRKTTDEVFNEEYLNKGIQPSSPKNSDGGEAYKQAGQIDRSSRVKYSQRASVSAPVKRRRFRKVSTTRKLKAKITVTRLNIMILSLGISSWLMIQLPLAIVSLGFLMAAGALETITRAANSSTENTTWYETIGISLAVGATTLVKGTNWLVENLTGFNLEALHPVTFFAMTYLLIVAWGIFLLMTIAILYKISFLHPLFGREGAGKKSGFFLLALVGYSIPILNIFPWFILWTIAVWKHPK